MYQDKTDEQIIELVKEHYKLDVLVFLDFETFFADKNRIGNKTFKLGPSRPLWKYVFDPLFHVTGLGFGLDMGPIAYPETPEQVAEFTKKFATYIKQQRKDGKRFGLVAHNTTFDGSILSWLYDCTFDMYFDTQGIEQLVNTQMPKSLAASLERRFPDDETMRKTDELASADGVALEDFTPELHMAIRGYCINDTAQMRSLFCQQLRDGFPWIELDLMHITFRAWIEPQFGIANNLLKEVIDDEKKADDEAISKAILHCHEVGIVEVSPKTFGSNPKYGGLLQKLGLTVPQKRSPSTGQMTLALGKNDPPYVKMQIGNPEHAPVYLARDRVKSTIASSRAKSMMECADLFRHHTLAEACMPFFLAYYGAENTGRWSGKEKLNQQNLQRASKHRLALLAQDGAQVGVNDLSNIELRVNLWFCEQNDLLAEFQNDPDFDMYAALASDIYGFMVNKKDHKDERQVGKAGSLGLGYSMSWYGFQNYLAGGPLGMEPMFVSDSFAKNVKTSYDLKHPGIVAMWNEIKYQVLDVLAHGGEHRFGRNNCCIARKDSIELPSGRVLRYPNTRTKLSGDDRGMKAEYYCDSTTVVHGRPLPRKIWHGLIIENCIQAIARDVLAYQMVITNDQLIRNGYGWVIGSVHDEILSMLWDATVEEGFSIMQRCMAMLPDWATGIPLASEGGYAREYSK